MIACAEFLFPAICVVFIWAIFRANGAFSRECSVCEGAGYSEDGLQCPVCAGSGSA
jgi:hypothetical protein